VYQVPHQLIHLPYPQSLHRTTHLGLERLLSFCQTTFVAPNAIVPESKHNWIAIEQSQGIFYPIAALVKQLLF
jgi:hypothetical protein